MSESRLEISLVAAVAENGVIGADGGMPWHYPADLRHFRETTTGHPVIMGRRTYESVAREVGGPLPERTSVVLTRGDRSFPEGAVAAGSVAEALDAAAADAAERGAGTAYVVGGAAVYEAFLPAADELRITEIPEAPAGDVRFPELGEEWTETERVDDGDLSFVTYRRR